MYPEGASHPHGHDQSVTLIVPNYNHGHFLRKALSGVLGQTCVPSQIVIVDDASTDNSLEIIRAVTAGHTGGNVEIVANHERMGVVAIMNRELARCQTEFIAFLAADDFVETDFLERSLAALVDAPQAGFSCGCVALRDGDWRLIGIRPAFRPCLTGGYVEPDRFRALLAWGDNFFLGSSVLYRRAALGELGGFDVALGSASDAIVQRRLAARHGFCFISRKIAVWRLHGMNFSLQEQQDVEAIDHLVTAAAGAIAREPAGLFPAGYAALLQRRMRFSIARQTVAMREVTDELVNWLLAVIKREGGEPAALQAVRYLPVGLRRVAVLAWLTLAMRPFSLGWLLWEVATRSWLTRPDRAG